MQISNILDPIANAERVITTCRRCGVPCQGVSISGKVMPVVCESCASVSIKADDLLQKYNNAGLYGRQLDETFDTYEVQYEPQRTVFERVKAFAENTQAAGWMVLHGNSGTGKDHLATAVVRKWVDLGLRCYAESAFGMMAKFRQLSYGDKGDAIGEVAALRWFQCLDLLVIRDLGTKQLTSSEVATLIDVIDRRYNACKALIVTTNLQPAEIEALLTSRITDRFAEMCQGGKATSCGWPSYRRSKNAQECPTRR